jgi:hypothetical protein
MTTTTASTSTTIVAAQSGFHNDEPLALAGSLASCTELLAKPVRWTCASSAAIDHEEAGS